MNREIIELRLAKTMTCIKVGEKLIADQLKLVADYESRGLDPSDAKALLGFIIGLQALHIRDLDHVRAELEGVSENLACVSLGAPDAWTAPRRPRPRQDMAPRAETQAIRASERWA